VATRFQDGATAPSVADGAQFLTANSASTVIVNFEEGVPDQEITVLCGDSQTVFNGPQLGLTAPMACKGGNVIRLRFDGAIWIETARTVM
jgi:hypothetical protein